MSRISLHVAVISRAPVSSTLALNVYSTPALPIRMPPDQDSLRGTGHA